MDTQLITNVILILVVVAAGYDRWKSGNSTTSKETIAILKEALNAKEIKIAEMKAAHDTAIATLTAELNAFKIQLEHLKEANLILTNTVTGKETLTIITDILKPLPPLFLPGGFIDSVRLNQDKTLKDLSEIREALRVSPSITTPENHTFKRRNTSTGDTT